ncbi:uncharacterized protein LOC130921537 [Corythoichthys intestinalis]|uniref:uncharacterized protein LOC130921537 n=1 Tax=Corythoichthys intestinalis TaxID=161448 RepID=UPI0025A59E05|nr:uncharacterized protein LOC130921537 [Corythoichthys intestinalis]
MRSASINTKKVTCDPRLTSCRALLDFESELRVRPPKAASLYWQSGSLGLSSCFVFRTWDYCRPAPVTASCATPLPAGGVCVGCRSRHLPSARCFHGRVAMEGSHCCVACGSLLGPSDTLNRCAACCGLSDDPRGGFADVCSSPSPVVLGGPSASETRPPSGLRRSKRRGPSAPPSGPRPKRSKVDELLASDVERLRREVAELRSLLGDRPPGDSAAAFDPRSPGMPDLDLEADAVSLAASASMFHDDVGESAFVPSELGSSSSALGSSAGSPDASILAVLRGALARLQLDLPQRPVSAPASAFFRHQRSAPNFAVPASADFVRELHAGWRDPAALSRLSADGRALAAMHDPAAVGLDRMPGVEPAIASLIVSPEESLRPVVRCPQPQGRLTDELILRAYGAGARAGRIGNSMAHLLLALSASLPESGADTSAVGFCDAALHAFALVTRELGRTMSYLVQARRQVWLAQSPLTEPARRTLRDVPVEPGHLFGSAAVSALERTISARATRQQLSGLRRGSAPAGGASRPPAPQGPSGPEGQGLRPLGRPSDFFFSHQQLRYWAARVSDPWVISTLTHGYVLQFRRRPPVSRRVRVTTVSDPARALALSRELSSLLAMGAIEPVDPRACPRGFYSTYFLVPKKTGGFRPVLDLRGLNRYLKVLPFRMLTVADVLRVVARGEWFTSVDLKDAYFHVPVAPRHRRFLRFAYRGRHWQFRVLPFGLSLSPRVFTRVVRAGLAPLQSVGMKILPYLDDWLLCAPSRAQAYGDTAVLLAHVDRLGIRVNLGKSCLVPSQQATFLGVSLDSVAMLARPSSRRVEAALRLLSHFPVGQVRPYLTFLRLLGVLTSLTAVVPLGLLFLRPLQRWLNGFRLDARRHRRRLLRVSSRCAVALAPWRNGAFLLEGVPLGVAPVRREVVTTDASRLGWGAVWQRRAARGSWSLRDHAVHINVLELRAVHLALRHFYPFLRGRHVLVRSDNAAAVYHINHQGGTRSAHLLEASRRLLVWAAPRLASLRAAYLPGQLNRLADSLSRRRLQPGEWRLHPEVVRAIWGVFGQAEVDLFASRESAHCPLWFSLGERSSPLGQDALAHPWPRVLLYAFPPLPLIWLTLRRVSLEGHSLLLVAPFWPARLWFPLLRSLCVGEPWCLPERRDLLSQLGGQLWHPDPRRLRLHVWPLRGPTRCLTPARVQSGGHF